MKTFLVLFVIAGLAASWLTLVGLLVWTFRAYLKLTPEQRRNLRWDNPAWDKE